jgi:hypothetical protein
MGVLTEKPTERAAENISLMESDQTEDLFLLECDAVEAGYRRFVRTCCTYY